MSRAAIICALREVLHRQPTPEEYEAFRGKAHEACNGERMYIPVAMYGRDVIVNNSVFFVSPADLVTFAFLQSKLFTNWVASSFTESLSSACRSRSLSVKWTICERWASCSKLMLSSARL